MAYRKISRQLGFYGNFSFPIKTKCKTVGVLNFVSKNSQLFSRDERRLISVIADQLGTAVENAWLYEQSKGHAVRLKGRKKDENERTHLLEDNEQQLQLLSILNDITRAVGLTLDLKHLMDTLLETMVLKLPCQGLRISLDSFSSWEFEHVAARNCDSKELLESRHKDNRKYFADTLPHSS
jgi:signal transduction protein with GAF and PtsI domain